MASDPDLLAHFMRYFEILRADTPGLLEEVFRLRYQVYCVEGTVPGFAPSHFADALERDAYDARSVHCLLLHRSTGIFAGTVRLVCADPARLDTPFPLEVASGPEIEQEYLRIASQFRSHSGPSAPRSIITGRAGPTGAISRTSSRRCGKGDPRYGVS